MEAPVLVVSMLHGGLGSRRCLFVGHVVLLHASFSVARKSSKALVGSNIEITIDDVQQA
jgi:hypothetical protein